MKATCELASSSVQGKGEQKFVRLEWGRTLSHDNPVPPESASLNTTGTDPSKVYSCDTHTGLDHIQPVGTFISGPR
jgi:hypothetical protein